MTTSDMTPQQRMEWQLRRIEEILDAAPKPAPQPMLKEVK